jgi:hypothetical protein
VIGATVITATIAFAAPASATPTEIQFQSSSCPTSLTYGEDDGCVAYLQDMLNTFGFGLSVDGQFGSNALAAVKWIQTKALAIPCTDVRHFVHPGRARKMTDVEGERPSGPLQVTVHLPQAPT